MLTRDLLAVTNLLVKHCQDQIKLLLTEIFEPIFSSYNLQNFPKFSKNVDGKTIYHFCNL